MENVTRERGRKKKDFRFLTCWLHSARQTGYVSLIKGKDETVPPMKNSCASHGEKIFPEGHCERFPGCIFISRLSTPNYNSFHNDRSL